MSRMVCRHDLCANYHPGARRVVMEKVQVVAQKMMDLRGFFVVCPANPTKIGQRFTSFHSTRPEIKGQVNAECVIIGEATREDYALQCEISGIPDEWDDEDFYYRAAAE